MPDRAALWVMNHPVDKRVLIVPERELAVWQGAHHGPLDRIVLPREPATDAERLWVDTELMTRLVPGGVIEVRQ